MPSRPPLRTPPSVQVDSAARAGVPCAVCGGPTGAASGLCGACASGHTPTPCTGDCGLVASGLCGGCLRTPSEIEGWSRCGASQRGAIYLRLLARRLSAAERVRRREVR